MFCEYKSQLSDLGSEKFKDGKDRIIKGFKNFAEGKKFKIAKSHKKRTKEYCDNYCESLNTYRTALLKRLTPEIIEQIRDELKDAEAEYFNLIYDKEKNGNKPYVAYIPIMEFQMKRNETYIQANYGSASHTEYKGDEIAKIQELYNNSTIYPKTKLPEMYSSTIVEDENGNPPKVKCLSDIQTLKKLYPTIILKRKNRNKNYTHKDYKSDSDIIKFSIDYDKNKVILEKTLDEVTDLSNNFKEEVEKFSNETNDMLKDLEHDLFN